MVITVHLQKSKNQDFPSLRGLVQIINGQITFLNTVMIAVHQQASIEVNSQGKLVSVWAPGNITTDEIDKALRFYTECCEELLSGDTK